MTSMDDTDCVVCGKHVYAGENGVRDFYELTHTYFELDEKGFMKLVSPETVRTLHFCSPACLCTYVDAKIRPDADAERPL
jgi:hypothetical protein